MTLVLFQLSNTRSISWITKRLASQILKFSMVRQNLFIILISILIPCYGFAQQAIAGRDFTRVDSFSRSIRYNKNIYELTKELTNPYPEQLFKVRAIFIWITNNIRYDYKFFNKGKEIKTPACKSGMNCEQLMRDWENAYLKKILKKKKGICDGYARLFKRMCDIAGIRSEIINGYTRTKHYQVGITGPVNHAWNAVWLDSTYFLLDATWAAGFCEEDEENGKLLNFQKSYNDYYWFTSFHDLSRNHYPQEGKWVFEQNYTKEIFAANPYYASDIISDIKLISPASGVINAKKGDTIHFKFDYKGEIRLLQVNSNVFRNPTVWKLENLTKRKKILKEDTLALKKQQYVPFKREGDRYEFEYVVPDSSLYFLELLFDYRRTMRFKFKIDRQTL